MSKFNYWSKLSGFYKLSLRERQESLLNLPLDFSQTDIEKLNLSIDFTQAEKISENVIGLFSLPLGIATNFLIDDVAVLVPMVTEEPSVIAAASNIAKIVGQAGGFFTKASRSIMKGQVQIYGFTDSDRLLSLIKLKEKDLLNFLNSEHKSLKDRGGGAQSIDIKIIKNKNYNMAILEVLIDVLDAMGANIINTLMEKLGKKIKKDFEELNIKIGLQILSNFCDQRLFSAEAILPIESLGSTNNNKELAEKILLAHEFAQNDIYRACTHNKGILNGIDALAIATGNDFRAIEAGAHVYALKNNKYQPLTSISLENNFLTAKIELPLAVGVVGGNINIHPSVQVALKFLGVFGKSSSGLGRVMASLGLAQCLAALRSLCNDGIQSGHMRLHKKKFL